MGSSFNTWRGELWQREMVKKVVKEEIRPCCSCAIGAHDRPGVKLLWLQEQAQQLQALLQGAFEYR